MIMIRRRNPPTISASINPVFSGFFWGGFDRCSSFMAVGWIDSKGVGSEVKKPGVNRIRNRPGGHHHNPRTDLRHSGRPNPARHRGWSRCYPRDRRGLHIRMRAVSYWDPVEAPNSPCGICAISPPLASSQRNQPNKKVATSTQGESFPLAIDPDCNPPSGFGIVQPYRQQGIGITDQEFELRRACRLRY